MASQLSNSQQSETEFLASRYLQVRAFTTSLCETLTPEDCCLQSMTSASPVRWHLAHTSWFFETFFLKQDPNYEIYHPDFEVLFNSYYNSVGEQFPRHQRGLLSRPTLQEIFAYREYVDEAVSRRLGAFGNEPPQDISEVIELGLQHEQQHQELMLTDIKHLFSLNPLLPTYREGTLDSADAPPQQWIAGKEGIVEIGHQGPGFCFDNEGPRHRALLQPHELSSRLVTNGEFLEFIEAGCYTKPELWLSLGWDQIKQHGWQHPLFWLQTPDGWQEFTLAGLMPLNLNAPVTHVSYFEADAFARWAGARLPSEAEWESAAAELPIDGNFADRLLAENRALHPQPSGSTENQLTQMFGDVWEWTSSPYTPYPGYRPVAGALGEYNGKFMCNQYVLRGGSVATSASHIRPTYRNFFQPESRWQFSGIRLARYGMTQE